MSKAKRPKLEDDAVNDDTGDSWSDEKFIETIQTVLGRYYYRSAERLQMTVKPPCYGDLERCSRNHWKSQDIGTAQYSMVSDCRSQKSQRNFSTFFNSINNICLMGLYPGPDILQLLIQIILDAGDEHEELVNPDEESPHYILHMGIGQFEMILLQFPPCILELEPSYSEILTRECVFEDMQGFSNGENGIVQCLVETLESLLEEQRTGKDDKVKSLLKTDTEDLLRMMNFDQMRGFSSLSRKTKIERLFVILHLLLKLMEFDLSMWMLRHPKKASESMLKPTKQPLIGKILWPNGDFTVSLFMKKCFGVFVESIAQDLPEDQLDIFGRLICLISNAVNLCEIQTTSEVQYPCIRQKSISLAETFMQITTDFRDPKPSLTIKVIKHITSPVTKMLMIDNFFSSISPLTGNVSITKIFKIFRRKDWIVQTKISQVEHVSLFMDAMKSWLDVYRLHDVFEAFSRCDSDKVEVPVVKVENTKKTLKERVAELEEKKGRKIRVDFRAIDRDLSKILKSYKLDIPIKYNEMNLDCNVIGIVDIYQLYLDEMKSVIRLHKMLVSRNQKYPSLFGPWMALIEKHFGYALAK